MLPYVQQMNGLRRNDDAMKYRSWYLKKIPLLKRDGVLIYPEGVWYYGVTPEDVDEIVNEHIINGRPVDRLMALQFQD